MFRRTLLAMLAVLIAAPVNGGESIDTVALWRSLQTDRHVILIRHAATVPGIGDPSGFTLGKCSTQRNLSSAGREDAKRIGDAFRSRNIPVTAVLSSRWCRCLDTARLAFDRVEPAPMLDSMFNDGDSERERKVREVLAMVVASRQPGNLVLVTHDVNSRALTGESVAQGEMVVTVPADGKLKVVGRLSAPGDAAAAR